MAKLIPYWISPNMITLLGSLQLFIPAIYDKVILGNPMLTWSTESTLIYAVCMFLALVLDSLDGCHARYTGFFSSGGFIMDHGADFIKIPLIGWYIGTMTSGDLFLNLFIIYSSHAGFTFCIVIMYNAVVSGKYNVGSTVELQMMGIVLAVIIWVFKAFLVGSAVDVEYFNSFVDWLVFSVVMLIYLGYFAAIFIFNLPIMLRISLLGVFAGTAYPIMYYYFVEHGKISGNGDRDAEMALILMYVYALMVLISSILMLSKKLEVSFAYYTTAFLVTVYVGVISLKTYVLEVSLQYVILFVILVNYSYILNIVYRISRYEGKYFLFVHNRYDQFVKYRAMKEMTTEAVHFNNSLVNDNNDINKYEQIKE